MTIALSTTLHASFDEAVELTREALAQQGFGILTEIDIKAALKAKLGNCRPPSTPWPPPLNSGHA